MSKSNSPINVLITHSFSTSLIQKLQEVSPRLRITVHPAQNINEVPDELWAHCEVLYTSGIIPDGELAPDLKWVQHHHAGIESSYSFLAKDRPNLTVTTSSGANASQVAEHVLTMLLAFGHQLPTLSELQKNSSWPKDRWERFTPTELRNSIVGIIGYGSIGRQVARLLREFGATVLATKNDLMSPSDNNYIPKNMGDPNGDLVHRLYPPQAMKTMLKDSDFIVVALPRTENTTGLINADVLSICKPTAFLVDVSRGNILDHEALIQALENKKLAGAALDVFPEEPLPKESPLWKISNIIITPHVAGVSAHYDERAIDLFAENLSLYLNDMSLYNIFDFTKGY